MPPAVLKEELKGDWDQVPESRLSNVIDEEEVVSAYMACGINR